MSLDTHPGINQTADAQKDGAAPSFTDIKTISRLEPYHNTGAEDGAGYTVVNTDTAVAIVQ